MHKFETERLSMRLLDGQDKCLYCQIYSDEKMMRRIGKAMTYENAEKSFHIALKKNRVEQSPFITWVICNKQTGQALGIQGLMQQKQSPFYADVGIMLLRISHGKQIPEEAVTGLLAYGFSQLNYQRVYASYSNKNYATVRVTKKMGFIPEETNATGSSSCYLTAETLKSEISYESRVD
ncbi:acetyltransferase, ribosomal protein N-acetylase [Shewanella psychrophila]|uniref:Acetyltransferase, ribosomal protein N-acetylase n=1 Tax=Shewanella psychrophila TaxID=225848 RepID=A0A1S6HVI6_9GAMM|nr:GNAT family N-acetyltransferase [Shewanella psychrophila]AQS39577.1 acetyltransferase, ribosomal protein N-acetylase [Shewanella psychrophila]